MGVFFIESFYSLKVYLIVVKLEYVNCPVGKENQFSFLTLILTILNKQKWSHSHIKKTLDGFYTMKK